MRLVVTTMTMTDEIKRQLVEGGLDEASVDRMLEHYREMRLYLGGGKYQEAILHVGKFCENAGNIILGLLGHPIEASPSLGLILTKIEKTQGDNNVDQMIRVTVPRFLRAAYEIRSKRDRKST